MVSNTFWNLLFYPQAPDVLNFFLNEKKSLYYDNKYSSYYNNVIIIVQGIFVH